MRRRFITGLTVAAIALAAVPAGIAAGPQKVFACSMGEVTTPEYDYMVASHVVYGTVTNVENVYFDGNPYRMATIVSDTALKGGLVKTVLTAAGSGQCGYTFELGHNYLMYANNRVGHPTVSAFDVYEGEEAETRRNALKDMDMTVLPEPGVHQITLYPGSDVSMTLDGKTIPVTPAPLYYQNSLYVPMAFFRDALGFVTIWNAESNRNEIVLRSEWAGIAAKGDPAQSQFTGNSAGIPGGTDPFVAAVTYSDVQAKVNGNSYPPENQPFNYDGVVYVALRETAERLGIQVKWEAETKTAHLKDVRPINKSERPVIVMKLASNNGDEPDLIVDRIVDDQVQYRYDRPVPYGETPVQMTAPFTELVKVTNGVSDYRVRLYLRAGGRENELIIKQEMMKSLLTEPDFRVRVNAVLGSDIFHWPENGIIGSVHLK